MLRNPIWIGQLVNSQGTFKLFDPLIDPELYEAVQRTLCMMRDEGLTLDEWRRLSAVPQREAEAAAGAITDLTAEREAVESVEDVMDATGEAMERIAALRAAVAGEVTQAEGLASCVAALRRAFDGFVLHRAESPAAPRRVNAELMVNGTYVLEPRVNEDARLGAMPAGTPGRQSLAAAAGAGHETPVPPRPQ